MAIDLKSIQEKRRMGFSAEKVTEDMRLNTILEGLEMITNDIVQNHSPKISESLFVNKYLDALAGIGENVEENYATYLSWIMDIAGNYNVPVHVCDDRTKEILFTVPAISNSQTINPEKAQTHEIRRAISIANDARFLQPYNWESILANNLHEIYKKMYDPSKVVLSKEQEQWFNIFKRYEARIAGKKRIEVTPELSSTTQDKTKEQTQQPTGSTTFDEVEEPI